jgi:kynurenine formamidase
MASDFSDLPAYDDLPALEGLGLRHAWGVFGEGDTVGTVNLLTPERVAAAASEVRTGEVSRLDLPLDLPDPPLFGRQPYRHEVFALSRNEMDDRLDNFHLQMSTQWDALCHVRAREHGYYGGRTDDPIGGGNGLGIENWSRGIVGRGVLLDVAGFCATEGRPLDPFAGSTVSAATLQETADAQGVALRTGDVLCVRLGWTAAYKALDAAGRRAYAEQAGISGLLADEPMARWLWDNHLAALCCDNPSIEALPGDPSVGSLHRRILPLMGFALGEMFDFDDLAERCHADNRWTFLFSAAPLNLPRGVGSPGNALAIR